MSDILGIDGADENEEDDEDGDIGELVLFWSGCGILQILCLQFSGRIFCIFPACTYAW